MNTPSTGAAVAMAANIAEFRDDPEQFENWTRAILPYLYVVAADLRRSAGLPPDLTDDIVNESVLVIQCADRGPNASPSGWIRSCVWTATNRVIAENGRARPTKDANSPRPSDGRGLELLFETHFGFESVDLEDVLSELPAKEADVLQEHFLVGKSQTEIAHEWDCSPPTISRLVTQALIHAQALST